MSEELNLVKDLAVILVAAGAFTLLSKALKQPLILGYIVAGFVVGPHLGLFSLTSTEAVSQWSEIGIIFLLFALGLEFSFKKLLKVGTGAMMMAGVKCLGMFVVGIFLAGLMNWSTMEGIFLGGLLSMSSTTIIIKAYGDMNLKNKPYAPVIFGSLVVEDLIAVLLMVLLSTLAASGHFEGGKMVMALGKLVFFLVLWFIVGIYVIPSLLKWVKKLLNDETLLILAIGLCFAMVSLADSVGFSSALGAFVMGSILSETLEGEKIEHLLVNIKDLFGAIFFVSVGMMVDPVVIGSQWLPILLITVFSMIGILIFSSTGALLAGEGLDTAVHAGFTLAQLGEFAFIIASLGCSMGVMRDFIYPVIIAVSVITTFTTPYMIKAADPVSAWLHRVLPKSFIDKVDSSTTDDYRTRSGVEKSAWKAYLSQYVIRVGIYTILLLALSMLSKAFLVDFAAKLLPSMAERTRSILVVAATLTVMAPFLYGLTLSTSSMKRNQKQLLEDRYSNAWTLLGLDIIRIFIVIIFILTVFTSHFDLSWKAILILLAIIAVSFVPVRHLFRKNFHLEERFFSNLDATDEREKQRSPVTVSVRENLEKYNVHVEGVTLSPESRLAGHTLRELPFRKNAQVNIIKIKRGGKSILIPSGDTPIYPYDRILAVGTESQLKEFQEIMKDEITDVEPQFPGSYSASEDFIIIPAELMETSPVTGRTLRDLKLRSHGCMVICILREDNLITNPSPDDPLKAGDLMWLAGEQSAIENLLARNEQ